MNTSQLREKYNELAHIFCPHIEGLVLFNSRGFGHLLYKNGARRRTESDIIKRFEYIELAQELLGMTTTVQEKEITENSIMYGYIAIFGELKFKVVIKKIGTGDWFFYSVIPHFVTSPKRD